MKKQIKIMLGIIIGILIVGMATAGILNIKKADFTVPEKIEPVRYKGYITFTTEKEFVDISGKKVMVKTNGTCYLDEPNMDIDDDFEDCLRKKYSGYKITDVIEHLSGNELEYKEVIIDDKSYRSFAEEKLKKIKEKKEKKIK